MALPGSRARRPVWKFLVPLVFVAAGTLFGTAATLSEKAPLRPEPRELAQVVRERNAEVNQLGGKVRAMRQEVAALEARQPKDSALATVRASADRLAPYVGTEAMHGPGVVVTLEDSKLTPGELPDGATTDDLVIHQQDVQGVINAMWAGGAEAVRVMDQRLTPTSSVQCSGNTLRLNGQVYGPPYTVAGIGDPDELEAALEHDASVSVFRQAVDWVGVGYHVERVDDLQMSEYVGPLQPSLATLTRKG